MTFEYIEPQLVWCIHFWDMSLYTGQVLGKEEGENKFYVRLEGSPINDIKVISGENIFYTEAEAERALFKANLRGDKRIAGSKNV